MTYRGDYASDKFRQSLNAVSITFHKDDGTRKQIRELYDLINSSRPHTASINRKIVGLIYDLCRKNGFGGITEYDIDQSFPEQNQTPTGNGGSIAISVPIEEADVPVDPITPREVPKKPSPKKPKTK
jgi:hypothetical protein